MLADPSFVVVAGASSHMRQPAFPRLMLVEMAPCVCQWEDFLGCSAVAFSPAGRWRDHSVKPRLPHLVSHRCGGANVIFLLCDDDGHLPVSSQIRDLAQSCYRCVTAARYPCPGARCFTRLAFWLAQVRERRKAKSDLVCLAPCSCSREFLGPLQRRSSPW